MNSLQTLKYVFFSMTCLAAIAVIAVLMSEKIDNTKGTEHLSIFPDEVTTCYEDQPIRDDKGNISGNTNIPIIYFVTPTYPRREQIPELTRLGQTLMHVKDLHWIVADDNRECNPSLVKLLRKFGIPLTVMASPMAKRFWSDEKMKIPRGVANRRAALAWIRNNVNSGVLYFGDDDNTFDLELFDQIRYTKKVSMLPVGLIGDFGVSSPVVKKGKVIGFFDSWSADREFPIDMAGFAVSVEFLNKSPEATMPYKVGYEEDMFLKSLGLHVEDIEPVAENCTKILVWHTQTIQKPVANLRLKYEQSGTSLDKLLNELYTYGIASRNYEKGVKTYYTSGRIRTGV
ncbi:galactosylgalactosylxylosylprotein 3-beta-glucuronosyltransferase S [Neodiprion virginianus]|uniref:galactosylgalactosylxylosylprotein 3-beta-glucuronosyltransferase S n=1 Tax=Neodiprion virginianus TaxID=2961670 RepID=UPI001EE69372|nr:galactosylgalactosylxylosylprotein 3-beta-glucuronosyltransferase S [Neodiprion virginianus]XP_046618613.1 galactosylgalactosylxylosylprotein 3-beta-glucuronosyltransferase S [Neodiprion virginianus]